MLIRDIKPDEIYNLAAMSHVRVSFDNESYTMDTNFKGLLNILQAVRLFGLEKQCKILQASSSEQMGNSVEKNWSKFLTLESKMKPVSLYGISKLAAHELCDHYRKSYGMHIVSAVNFNHTSSRRGNTFVLKKIMNYVKTFNTQYQALKLGNVYSSRCFLHAKEVVQAMYLSLQKDKARDYILGSKDSYTIKELVNMAFEIIGVSLKWVGEGLDEKAYCFDRCVVEIDERYYRKNELEYLCCDSSESEEWLGFHPEMNIYDILQEIYLN
jgi:GDPmannose 4,6-dehydratase